MSEQRHVIKRQVIELKIRKSAEARLYQDELSRIYRQRIIPLIDRCCSELCKPDRLYRIESLNLDLGPLDMKNLEEDFTAKAETALRRELASQIGVSEESTDHHSGSPVTQSQLELFAHFARTGNLPWWAELSHPELLTENLEKLMRTSPAALQHLLRQLTRESQACQRMVNHYTDEQLAALTGLLLPIYEQALERDFPVLFETLHGVQAASSELLLQFRRSLWKNLLMIAGTGGGQYASLAALYQAVLKRVVIDLGARGSKIMTTLHATIQNGRTRPSHQLSETIARLSRAEAGESTNASEILAEKQTDQTSKNPSEKISQGTSIVTPERDTQTEQEFLASRDVASGKTPIAASERILSTQSRQELPPDKEAIDTTFSDTDELLIGNAGLVILWPFLVNFFTRLNLLDKDRRFMDFAAQQRAVGLLQVVAAQDSAPREYLLPLNKLLCGMELTEVFNFGAPVLDSEIKEGVSLLEAVIAQAPILHDMSIDGFRGTFLLRSGLITARDGMWLLHVERQTYDIVLERFPWSWEWVKLPWMETPLRVDW